MKGVIHCRPQSTVHVYCKEKYKYDPQKQRKPIFLFSFVFNQPLEISNQFSKMVKKIKVGIEFYGNCTQCTIILFHLIIYAYQRSKEKTVLNRNKSLSNSTLVFIFWIYFFFFFFNTQKYIFQTLRQTFCYYIDFCGEIKNINLHVCHKCFTEALNPNIARL